LLHETTPRVQVSPAIRPAPSLVATRPVAGQARTFDEVYRDHVQNVARWVNRLAGPGADVEDLTQEVFLVVDRRLPEFRGDSAVSTWLFRIAANVAANDRRRRAIRPWWKPVRLAKDHALPISGETPLERLERRERQSLFYEVLDRLREDHRRALVLFELEQLPVREIAQMLGRTEGNVRVLVHRARAAFLKRMIRERKRGAKETP
jgi:RNA polymerase sigma-70 factor (ECF subfamily)